MPDDRDGQRRAIEQNSLAGAEMFNRLLDVERQHGPGGVWEATGQLDDAQLRWVVLAAVAYCRQHILATAEAVKAASPALN
jgi:hypothetical protein